MPPEFAICLSLKALLCLSAAGRGQAIHKATTRIYCFCDAKLRFTYGMAQSVLSKAVAAAHDAVPRCRVPAAFQARWRYPLRGATSIAPMMSAATKGRRQRVRSAWRPLPRRAPVATASDRRCPLLAPLPPCRRLLLLAKVRVHHDESCRHAAEAAKAAASAVCPSRGR